jgi:UDP-N-acetylglucosamine/UDP-N-acetylgalactosamine diphosphorylase
MIYTEAVELLKDNGQEQILRFWDQLDELSKSNLLVQIETIDFDSVKIMQDILKSKDAVAAEVTFEPAPVIDFDDEERSEAAEIGEKLLCNGKVGALLVAGGQGTRLGFDGPKGAFSIGPVSDNSLFAIHAHKISALERKYGTKVPFYIMTSQANDAATRLFFEQNNYFGLAKERVMFFVQGMWPTLTPDGKIIMDSKGHIFMSPDGHGGLLSALATCGIITDMEERGLNTIFFFQVDNPLVEIADPAFIGVHYESGSDLSVKVCAKRDPDEGLGVVVEKSAGHNAIVEYTELTAEQKNERLSDGELKYKYGSVAIHVFSVDFLKRESVAGLPLHVAHKKVPYCDDNGETVKPEEPNAYKFEKFIFDALPDAEQSLNVVFAREDEFSPVKNADGSDSPATAKTDIMLKFARWMEACGVTVPRNEDGSLVYKLEIDPRYAIGVNDLKSRLPDGFVVEGDLLLQ